MRLSLGLILMALGGVGGYLVLSGKFPPTTAATTTPTAPGVTNMPGSAGSAGGGNSQAGSGGASLTGMITHWGLPTQLHYNDGAGRVAYR